MDAPCPACGYCPHCGRRNLMPIVPAPIVYPIYVTPFAPLTPGLPNTFPVMAPPVPTWTVMGSSASSH